MVWVDRIIQFKDSDATGETVVREGSLFMDANGLIASSCIELIGQCFGYAWACVELDRNPNWTTLNHTLLAGFRNVEYPNPEFLAMVKPRDVLQIRTWNYRRRKSITMLSGLVSLNQQVLCNAELRVFIGTQA